MHQPRASNWTDVVFGVLSVPKNVPINSVSLSVLRSSLVDLVLRQSNLFLTTSIFGQPSSFEILKFHGGITVSPVQSVSIWQISQILFTFILYNSVSQIQENFDQFNEQLKFGLHLRSYENVYVQVTNKNGSTLAPPVTVQASILSGVGSHNLLPQRLKQLAQTITRSPPAKNLGLDHSVFGKVKEIMLSSLLNHTLRTSQGSPTPSPSPSEDYFSVSSVSPYPAPPPSYAPAPSVDNRYLSPCIHCDTLSPSGNTFPYAPTPENGPQYPLPPISKSPSPSMMTTHSPRHGPCCGPSFSPSPFPTANSNPSAPSNFSPRAPVPHPPVDSMLQLAPNLLPLPAVSYGSNPGQDKRSGEASVSPLASLPISPSPSSFATGLSNEEMWLIGLLGPLTFHLLCINSSSRYRKIQSQSQSHPVWSLSWLLGLASSTWLMESGTQFCSPFWIYQSRSWNFFMVCGLSGRQHAYTH